MILFIDDDNVDGGGAASRSVSFIGMRWGSLGSLHALWRPFLVNDLWPTADELLRFVSRVGCVLIVAQVVVLLANRGQGSNRSTIVPCEDIRSRSPTSTMCISGTELLMSLFWT